MNRNELLSWARAHPNCRVGEIARQLIYGGQPTKHLKALKSAVEGGQRITELERTDGNITHVVVDSDLISLEEFLR